VTLLHSAEPGFIPTWTEVATIPVEDGLLHVQVASFYPDPHVERLAERLVPAPIHGDALITSEGRAVDPRSGAYFGVPAGGHVQVVPSDTPAVRTWQVHGGAFPDTGAVLVAPGSAVDVAGVARAALSQAAKGGRVESYQAGCPTGAQCARVKLPIEDLDLTMSAITVDRVMLLLGPTLAPRSGLLRAQELARAVGIEVLE